MQKAAYRFRVQLDAVFGQGCPQFPHRLVLARRHQTMDKIAMRLKAVALVASILAGRDRAGLPVPLAPLDDRRNRQTKPIGHPAATVACLKRCNRALAKIKGIGSNHDMLASFSSQHVESEKSRFRNP